MKTGICSRTILNLLRKLLLIELKSGTTVFQSVCLRPKFNKNNISNLEFTNSEKVNFAHKSEKEFARILDFYLIRWLYEPTTFPLEWDEDDRVVKSFTPDFYLPDYDLYVELTTLNQKLVTKKNRKLKTLKKLYPDVNIKLFYKKDYHSLIFKFINK